MVTRVERLLRFTSARKLPLILQAETAECGLACLAMVAGYHGYQTDMVRLRQKFLVSNHGTDLKQLMLMASRLELAARPLKLDVGQLGQLQLPCILHWGMDHFVVLKKLNRINLEIHDPEQGRRLVPLTEVNTHFTGVALELRPTSEFIQTKPPQKLKLSHFWDKITGLKRSLINIMLLALLLQLFAVISPFYMQTVVDDVVLRNDTNLLMVLALGFGLLLTIQTATSLLREYLILYLANNLNIQMAANLFRHLVRLPMEYFNVRHMGDVVSRFGSLNQVREILTTGVLTALLDGFLALLTLLVMLIYSVRLTLVVLAVVVLYAGLRYLLFRPLRILTEEQIAASAKHDTHFMESVRAIQTIKLFEKEDDRQSQWQNVLVNAMNKSIRIDKWNINYRSANQFLFGLEGLIVVYFAAQNVIEQTMTLGMFYAFLSYKVRFTSAVNSFIDQFIEIKMLDVHLCRLADIAFTSQDQNLRENNGQAELGAPSHITIAATAAPIFGKVEVKNLAYRYGENEEPIFKGLSFTIEAGETVALTGSSGCGKTTLMKCLMGLFTPFEGEILIDGVSLKKHHNYRSQIAAVMQDDQLLSGSIAENIACFEANINLQKVYTCATLACIHEEIMAMTMHYNSLVGDMGSSLSGGQLQRIVLARALYREPTILFLDEATSHLDVTNEAIISDGVRQLKMTRIMAAHRPETVKSADRVIRLD